MNDIQSDPTFSEIRPRLVRLAYRMLGSVADAEDIVQDAYLRWLATDQNVVRQPVAFLHTIVTRLCLNELKSARRRRETYVGPSLPEPIINTEEPDSIDDITLPLMIALERLSPLERAAFLLHDVFGMGFDDIANVIDRETAACRKLASRARNHIEAARPRFPVTKEHGLEIATAFYTASRSGDMKTLHSLLAQDVIASTDGGGKVPASSRPLIGIDEVMARHEQLAQEFGAAPSLLVRFALIDGLPGFITVEKDGIVQTTALQIDQEKVVAIYITRNPDKLQHLDGVSLQ
ncbi:MULTISPECIES: sigma-70 family RNA polymerase sigma factor [Actibacterium]|uniref:RNA polymerase sigma-70 factor (ECF subfamily) n=1 Tax=Actibacterium naphthalenivorans TaxID=1614693 RepID=A0A840CGD2_9RHOB|nr:MULTISPECIES: sigma-70 family RNA polymerase sigma factor [Actibacterium]ALG90397.1 RNA polymerase sigma factor SigJ [Actibacterium sp. EMB200-NS6]MBB4022329.1 RNA polymerase sigma-70 factor (ECF subfamily) [Actibacterium naphthalenivorans]